MNVETNFEGQLVISDITGRQVIVLPFNANKGEFTMDLNTSSLNTGIYMLNVITENGVVATSKFIKK